MKEILTYEGYQKLSKKLEYLKLVRRQELAEHLKFATDLGDLRENAEYDAALMEYEEVESTIYKLEKCLSNCTVVNNNDKILVSIGSIVSIKYDTEFEEYNIVGPSEVDPLNNKISYKSKVGSLLLGKKVSDIINIDSSIIEILDIK